MELLESLLGGWWMLKTPIHQSLTFRRQKIPAHYLLFNCQILGKISLGTALTGFTWNWGWHPPAAGVGWEVWRRIPERSLLLRGRFGTGHWNAELHLWPCSLAISHVQRGDTFFFWPGIMIHEGAEQIKMVPSAQSNVSLPRWSKCLPALFSVEQR